MLYPYRANDAKNRVRWQFGVLMPPGFAELDPSERAWLQTDCLLEGRDADAHRAGAVPARAASAPSSARRRTASRRRPRSTSATRPTCRARRRPCTRPTSTSRAGERHGTTELDSRRQRDRGRCATDGAGRRPARAARGAGRCARLQVAGRAAGRPVRRAPGAACGWTTARRGRRRRSARTRRGPTRCGSALVAAHVCSSRVAAAVPVSQLEPPEWARGYVADCENVGVFPVLAGPAGGARHRPGVADHPVRPRRGGAGERGRVLRRHRDGRDAHAARDDAHRGGEAAGARQRSARGRRSWTTSTTCRRN